MNQNTNTMLHFTTISQAKKDTGFSYIGSVNSSAKMLKSQKNSKQYTYIIYLAPAKTSGYQVCPFATKECKLGCLATSGHAGMEIQSGGCKIQNSRIGKTKLFFEDNEFFMEWVIEEIKSARRKAERAGYYFSVRLNGTSDIDWQNVKFKGYNLFEIFPDVQFYDYTKNYKKFENLPDNYHLTYSYTGRNWDKCKALLEAGHNVAMVFNVRKETDLPSMYKGYKVVNGDLTDYRVADAKGIIVGLKWKRIANKQNEAQILQSCFVVNLPDVQGVNINPKYLQVA